MSKRIRGYEGTIPGMYIYSYQQEKEREPIIAFKPEHSLPPAIHVSHPVSYYLTGSFSIVVNK